METELLASVTQFGTAGLIAYMWLSERRSASAREQELHDALERMNEQHMHIDALVKLVADNTRALAAIEGGQRALVAGMTALASRVGVAAGEVDPAVRTGDHG